MNKLALILTITIIASISTATSCMHNKVIIKIADNQEYGLLQWKIEASRLLHTKQELQAFKEKYSGAIPAPITLKTISAKKVYLFSNVLDEHDIPTYVKRLNAKKRNLLLCAVAPKELDSPYIMCELLKTYFPQDLIEAHINPHLPTTEVVNCLQGLIMRDNCKHKEFTQTRTKHYEGHMAIDGNGGYNYLPHSLANTTNFSGTNLPIIDTIDSSDDKWLIENFTNTTKEKNYFLTPMNPINSNDDLMETLIKYEKENKKRLWIEYPEKNTLLQSTIEHTNAITCHAFSNDGKYLATSSAGPDGQLILTNLNLIMENDTSIGRDIVLKGHTGSINCICFNKQSTILATAGKGIYFWDTQTGALLAQLPIREVTSIQFNYDGTRCATINSFRNDHNHRIMILTLWNSTDFNNITMVQNWADELFENIMFTPSGNNIIVKMDGEALVLNGCSGEVIMKTKLKEDNYLSSAVMISHHPILITTSYNDSALSEVSLWDINSNNCITTLLENEQPLAGLGVSDDGRFIVSTDCAFGMIQTELYDNDTHDCLQWIQNKLNPTQRYFLRRLYRAYKDNNEVCLDRNSAEYRTLQNLPFTPCNVKAMIENYLLKK